MLKLFIFSAAVILCCSASSQTQMDNWVFGDSAGISFETGEALAFKTKIITHEASASISDEDGNLIFYTNGNTVWNRANEVMFNGDSLNIAGISDALNNPSTITQGVIIIPAPLMENIYYIFYISGDFPIEGLDYAIIDMTLNDGFGAVTEKNIRLYSDESLWEKMQAVRHGNGRDWWLLLHNGESDDSAHYFVRFLISPDGISEALYQIDENMQRGTTGQMKFSQAGDKLAFTRFQGNVSVYSFNRCTGLLNNELSFDIVDDGGVYGCEFSPDGNNLYIGDSPNIDQCGFILQVCLDCPGLISENTDTIYNCIYEEHAICQLQLGPDDRIYLTTAFTNSNANDITEINTFISVINNPNLEGVACAVDTLSIPLVDSRCTFALPNMPNYTLGPLEGSECDTLLSVLSHIVASGIRVYPNPASDHITVSGDAAYSNENLALYLYNLVGEEIFSIRQLQFNKALKLPQLASGLYSIVLMQGERIVYTEKLQIVH